MRKAISGCIWKSGVPYIRPKAMRKGRSSSPSTQKPVLFVSSIICKPGFGRIAGTGTVCFRNKIVYLLPCAASLEGNWDRSLSSASGPSTRWLLGCKPRVLLVCWFTFQFVVYFKRLLLYLNSEKILLGFGFQRPGFTQGHTKQRGGGPCTREPNLLGMTKLGCLP